MPAHCVPCRAVSPYPPSQTPWQEIQRGIVAELSEGMVLKPAVKYQKIHATFGIPRDNH
jgi:dihydroxy-acid dehydratase